MSVPAKGNGLPKKGKELPLGAKRQELARVYALAIGEALSEEVRRGASIKKVMSWTGASERTVKGWMAGSSAPSGEYLVGLLRSSDLILGRLLILADRGPITSRRDLEALRAQIRGLGEAIDAALAQAPLLPSDGG